MPAATASAFTGIHNENEFYSHHYLSEILSGDIRSTVDRWRESAEAGGEPTPYATLRALAGEYVPFRRDFDREHRSGRRLTLQRAWFRQLLPALGYEWAPADHPLDSGDEMPVLSAARGKADAPTLLALAAYDPEAEGEDPLQLKPHPLQQVIRLMSLTRPAKGRRGRISYAQLGINQLGAVYEALLSYRGFFAEEDLYEVKKAGDHDHPLKNARFVPARELDDYTEDERVYDNDDDGHRRLRVHPRGRFIHRLAGRDQQETASYYTPEPLTRCVVKYALRELVSDDMPVDRILDLTVCGPAMGSAAFLNEAVSQLAEKYLERKQRELGERIPHADYAGELQHVKHYIADRHVYGVDLNPARELAEVSLWFRRSGRTRDRVPRPLRPLRPGPGLPDRLSDVHRPFRFPARRPAPAAYVGGHIMIPCSLDLLRRPEIPTTSQAVPLAPRSGTPIPPGPPSPDGVAPRRSCDPVACSARTSPANTPHASSALWFGRSPRADARSTRAPRWLSRVAERPDPACPAGPVGATETGSPTHARHAAPPVPASCPFRERAASARTAPRPPLRRPHLACRLPSVPPPRSPASAAASTSQLRESRRG